MRAGYWVGRAPIGYRVTGDRYRKSLVVDPALAPYVPEVYRLAIEGRSLRAIADYLTAAGVPTETLTRHGRGGQWNEGVVRNILANDTYSGTHTRQCAECGGSHDLTVPVLVDEATQARARKALSSRQRGTKGGAGGRPSAAPAMLVPLCDACGIAMYRIVTLVKGHRYEHYYCKTRTSGGRRVGCGLVVRCDRADAFADAVLSANDESEIEIERVRRSERAAFEADDDEKMAELRQQRRALEAELATTEAERVRTVPARDPETGEILTIGAVWSKLDPAARRGWLKRRGIEVRLSKTQVRLGYPWKTVDHGDDDYTPEQLAAARDALRARGIPVPD
jgi:hypothetical protein